MSSSIASRLGELARLRTETVAPGAANGLPYVALEHLDSGEPVIRRWASSDSARSAKSRFHPGDVLYGKLRPYLDKSAMAEIEGVASTELLVLEPRPGIDGKYLSFLMHSSRVLRRAVATTSGVNHPRTSWSALSELDVLVPPLEDQQRVALRLSRILTALNAHLRAERATSTVKATMLARLFGLRYGNDDAAVWMGGVGSRSDLVNLDRLAQVQTGVTVGQRTSNKPTVEVPYLRVANVLDGGLDLTEVKTIAIPEDELPRRLLREGDVVVTEGGDEDKLGRGYLWDGSITQCAHQNHIFAIRSDAAKLDPAFLAYFIQSPPAKSYFRSVAHRTTNLACINSTKLKALPVPSPSLDEQRLVVRYLRSTDRKLDAERRQTAAIRQLLTATIGELIPPP